MCVVLKLFLRNFLLICEKKENLWKGICMCCKYSFESKRLKMHTSSTLQKHLQAPLTSFIFSSFYAYISKWNILKNFNLICNSIEYKLEIKVTPIWVTLLILQILIIIVILTCYQSKMNIVFLTHSNYMYFASTIV